MLKVDRRHSNPDYLQFGREAPSSEDSKDEKLAGKLWALSDRLVSSYL